MEDEVGNAIDRPSGHPWLRLTRTLEVDQVLTIEPGCYVIDMLLENLQGTTGATMVNKNKVDWLLEIDADSEFQEFVDRMDALQLELVNEVKVGVDFKDLHLLTHRKVADLLVAVGLASGSTDALIENDVTAAFFPTGLGHLLGIQVHDVGGFMEDEVGNAIDRPSGHPWLRLTRTLEVDQVLTIEPGCYVIDMLLENLQGTTGATMVNKNKVDWLRPFGGARIEDNVRVLADGCENFTRAAFANA